VAKLDFFRNRFDVTKRNMDCYGFGEMPAPNHKGRWTSGGSHGDDTESDGASLTGPQPYTEGENESFAGIKRELCSRGPSEDCVFRDAAGSL